MLWPRSRSSRSHFRCSKTGAHLTRELPSGAYNVMIVVNTSARSPCICSISTGPGSSLPLGLGPPPGSLGANTPHVPPLRPHLLQDCLTERPTSALGRTYRLTRVPRGRLNHARHVGIRSLVDSFQSPGFSLVGSFVRSLRVYEITFRWHYMLRARPSRIGKRENETHPVASRRAAF